VDKDQFDALVERAEHYARDRPAAYRFRVVGLGLLGYAYIGVILAGLVAGMVLLGFLALHGAAMVAVKFIAAVAILVIVVLRAFWIRIPAPAGRPLTRPGAPRLFGLVDEVIKSTGAPRLSAVILTHELNAAIQQSPRFGPFLGYRNYLLIGLPLLEALSLDEFRAVLAHECGHLSGAHGKATAWVYRVRMTWTIIAHRLEASGHWGRNLFVPFFKWYAPRFLAYSYVMAREQEYAADAVAASVTSPATSGAALLRVELTGRWLGERFWPRVFKGPQSSPAPNVAPFAAIGPQLALGFAEPDMQRWFGAALNRDTGTADTHPSLRDRLLALGVDMPRLSPIAQSAAEHLLGRQRSGLAAEIDARWQREVADWWAKAHSAYGDSLLRRDALERKGAEARLPLDEQLELARLHLSSDDLARARPLLEAVLAAAPRNADAHAHLGALLSRSNDSSAVGHLYAAIRYDRQWTLPAGQILHAQLLQAGRQEEANALLKTMDDFAP
jgi:Zn-dependent protease with chaperone function